MCVPNAVGRRTATSVPSAARFCVVQPTLMPSKFVTTKRVCQSISNGACSVEKMVSPTTPSRGARQAAKQRCGAASHCARSMSASNFGSMMTTMQMMKIKSACAVPLKFRYGVNACTGMSERPVYF